MNINSDEKNEEAASIPTRTDETFQGVSESLERIALQQQSPGEGEGVGNINILNMSNDITPMNVNIDEPIRDLINRATSGVRSDNFHFELKNGTRLSPETTLRNSGVDFDAYIRLVENISPDSGIAEPPSPVSSEDSIFVNASSKVESVVDESELDKLLDEEMSDNGTIVITDADGNFREMPVNKSETVNQILTRVVGPDTEDYDLIDNDRSLPRNISIRSAGIPFRRNLKVREREVQIYVRLVDGRKVTINARRSQNVLHLKERLRDQIQVPLHQQRLQFQSKPLEDERTLKSYGIRNHSHIESTYRLRGGCAY